MRHRDTIQKGLREREGLPVSEAGFLDLALDREHEYVIQALDDIVRRAGELLDDLRSDDVARVMTALHRIADSAGASGPIASQYAKAIAHAAKAEGLVRGYRAGHAEGVAQ